MKRSEFEKLVEEHDFDYAVRCLDEQESPCLLTDFETLKLKAIELLKEDNLMWALHILNAIYDSPSESDWYAYDYTAGTTFTPHCLVNADDVATWIGFDEENK